MSFKEFFHLTHHDDSIQEHSATEVEHTNEVLLEKCETIDEAYQVIRSKRESGTISSIEEAKILAPFLEQALINKDFLTLQQMSTEWEFEQDNFKKTLLQAVANLGIEKGTEILHTKAFQEFAEEKGIQTEMLEIFSGLLHDSKRAA